MSEWHLRRLLPPTATAYRRYRRCLQLPRRRVAGRPSRQIASASRRLGVAYGEGSEGPRRSLRPPPGAAGELLRRLPSVPADFIGEKKNSEVGIWDADFTYIKKPLFSEVGIRDADFGTVEVGIPYADFLFFVYGFSWKSTDGLLTSAQWKSVIQVPTSIYAQCFLF